MESCAQFINSRNYFTINLQELGFAYSGSVYKPLIIFTTGVINTFDQLSFTHLHTAEEGFLIKALK